MRGSIFVGLGAAVVIAAGGLATARASTAGSGPRVVHAAPAAWPVEGLGVKGEQVRVIQYLLRARGFGVAVDGAYGRSTAAAVKAFQHESGVRASGRVGPATWPKLVVTIKRGSRGDAVRALEHQIRYQSGARVVPVDGVFGARLQEAVKTFQVKHRRRVSGVVDAATWRAIEGRRLPGEADIAFYVKLRLLADVNSGTVVTLQHTTNGNCATDIRDHSYLVANPIGGQDFSDDEFFAATNGGICDWQGSYQQYSVTAHFRDGTSQFRLVNWEERDLAFVEVPKVDTVCAWPYDGLECKGGLGETGDCHPPGACPPLAIWRRG
jgi:hypothetical protein